jgi:hypothetical protein
MKEETALGKVSFFHQKALLLIFGNFFDYFSHQKSSLTYFFKIFFFCFSHLRSQWRPHFE